jgi:hypothetical protein
MVRAPSKLGRVLRLLKATKAPLSDSDRERLSELAASENWYVRASCLRFACEAADDDLGMQILAEGRYFGSACWLEETWGSHLVLRFAAQLTFDEVASRVHPAVLAHCLAPRGNRPQEVRAFAGLLEAIFQEVLDACDPPGITIPGVVLSPQDRPLGTELPNFEEPEEVTIRADGRSPDALRKFFDQFNEVLSGQGDAEAKRMNAEIWARHDAVIAAWGTTAFKWFGRTLGGPALRSMYDCAPHLIEKWVRRALGTGPDGAAARARLGTFFAEMSLMLMSRSPGLGCSLWRFLYAERANHATGMTVEFPFVAEDSPEVAEVRRDVLEECWDDSSLSQIAYFCERHGRQVWMKAVVDALVVDPLLWRRAKGLAFASFACITENEFERIVERAQIRGTWVEHQISGLRGNVRDNVFAQHWYRLFLRSADPDVWWSAFQVVRRCGDERFWTWHRELEAEDGAVDLTTKLAYLAVNSQDTEKELNRAGDRKKRLCGLDVEHLEILPFSAGP